MGCQPRGRYQKDREDSGMNTTDEKQGIDEVALLGRLRLPKGDHFSPLLGLKILNARIALARRQAPLLKPEGERKAA